MAITTHALDLARLHLFLWGFEEREKIMIIMKEFLGARLHAALYSSRWLYKLILPRELLNDMLEI